MQKTTIKHFGGVYVFYRSKLIEKPKKKPATIVTWIVLFFMVTNVLISTTVLDRYNKRGNDVSATNTYEQMIDDAFPDEWVQKRYSNAKLR